MAMAIKKLLIKRILPAGAMLLWAAGGHAEDGGSAYSFLNIPSSAHAFALGGVAPAIIDPDLSLVEQNPALLGPEIEKQVQFGYMHYLGSSNFASLRYGQAAGDRAAWSAGIRYLNYGSMQGYDENGVATGSFTPQDLAFEGSYSHDINDRLRGGATFKMLYSSYEQYTAFALAVDLGINYYNEDHDLSFSLVLANMGGQLKRFQDAYNRLPFDIRIGYMQGLGHSPFSLAITAWNLTRWKQSYYNHNDSAEDDGELKESFFSNLFRHLNFGLQYSPSEKFYAAIGYNYKTRTDMSGYQRNFLSGFSIGAGFNTRVVSVGLAYAMPHKKGSELLLNLSMNIGELLP